MRFTRSAQYAIRIPEDPSAPDVPEAMRATVTDIESVIGKIDSRLVEGTFYKKESLQPEAALTELSAGAYSATNRTVAQALSLPGGFPGTVYSTPVGSRGGTLIFNSLLGNDYTRRKFEDKWSNWVESGENRARRDLARQHLLARKGQSIGTDGRGVIALRFDDYEPAFREKVLPLLKDRGLPFTRVTTSESMAGEQISADDFSAMQDYCLDAGGEVWNHGRTHRDATFMGDVQTELIEPLYDLRAKLPRLPIDCFAPPGWGVSYGGYMPANKPSSYTDTYAGKQMLAHHALVTGYLPDSYWWQLDGKLKDGYAQYSMDSYTYERLVERTNFVRDNVVGMVFYWHPGNFDTDSGMSLSDFERFLDYLVQQRSYGAIEVLTVSGLAAADASHSRRHNVLSSSVSAYESDSYDEVISEPRYRRGLPGSTRVLRALIKAAPGSEVTSQVGNSQKTHVVPRSGYLRIFHPVTIPLDVGSTLRVAIGAKARDVSLTPV